jgi:hypothetical protein
MPIQYFYQDRRKVTYDIVQQCLFFVCTITVSLLVKDYLSRWVLKLISSPRPTNTPLLKAAGGSNAKRIVSLILTSYLH